MKKLLQSHLPELEPRYRGEKPFSELHHGTRRVPLTFACLRDHEVLVRDTRLVLSPKRLDELCGECSREEMLFSNRFPERAAMWRDDNSIPMEELTPSMDEPRFFLCPQGHEFQRNPWAKVKREFCPRCFSLGTFVDHYGEKIAALWDEDRNGCSPEEYPGGRNVLLHFICPLGHSFSRFPQGMDRVKGNLCPECRDVEKLGSFPQQDLLESLWDHGRNEIPSHEVPGKSRDRYWLLCPQGHSYQSQLRSLAAIGGCKFCLGSASLMEQEVKRFLEGLDESLTFSTGVRGILPERMEIDLLEDDRDLALEVNGDYWHSDGVIAGRDGLYADGESYHRAKLAMAEELGISLVFLWEHHWKFHGDDARVALEEWVFSGEIHSMFRVFSSPLDASCSICND